MQTFKSHALPVEIESVSNVTLTNSVNLGEVRFIAGEEYIYAYNAGPQQISQGQFAVLSAASGFSVTVSSVTNYDFPIGVVKHATFVTAGYGWLLTRGFSPVALVANNSATTADVIYPGALGLFGVLGQAASSITGTNLQPIGYIVSGAASGASGGIVTAPVAYVRCYGT